MNWRLIFLPLSMAISWLYAFFAVFAIVMAGIQLFKLSWIFLVLLWSLASFIGFHVVYSIPTALRFISYSFYGLKKLPNLLHALAAVDGFFLVGMYFVENPIGEKFDGEFRTIFWAMWKLNPGKFVLISIPSFFMVIGLLWHLSIVPIKSLFIKDQI